MSDSDDDNIVRYGTQLEPYEEDHTRTMTKTKKRPNLAQKRMQKLRAAIISENATNKANLRWQDNSKQRPEIEPKASVTSSKKNKKRKKKKSLKARVYQEPQSNDRRSRDREIDREYFYRDRTVYQPSRERETPPIYWNDAARRSETALFPNENEHDQEYFDEPHTFNKKRSHTNYWDEAGPSRGRDRYETNIRESFSDVEPDWEPPYKITKTSSVEPNYWERPNSSLSRRQLDEIPMECSSNNSFEHDPRLKYIDADDCLQVKVQNGTRAVKRHYNDNNDEGAFCEQPYKVQKTSTRGDVSLNYWEPDRPSRIGLRNETHPTKHGLRDDSHDRNFWESTHNAQKTSQNGSVKLEYGDPDRPSRVGLRNETHPMRRISVYDSDEERTNGRVYEARTPVESISNADYMEAPDRKETKPDINRLWDEPLEQQETYSTDDAKLFELEPVRVGIRNVTPITKKQMVLIHQAINNAIVRIGVQGAGPKFLGSTYKVGWILMICENHESRKWLEKEIPKLKPWSGASLSVMPQNELPKPIVLSILIPTNQGVTNSTALELLRIQNPGLDTKSWKVFKVMRTRSGNVLFVSVDEKSFQSLRLVSFRVNLGMDKLSFWVKSGPKPQGNVKNISVKNRITAKTSKDIPKPNASRIKKSSSNKSLDRYFVPSSSPACQGESGSMKGSAKRSRTFSARSSQTIENELRQNLPGKQEPKSPPSKKWYPQVDQSYSSSDWIPW